MHTARYAPTATVLTNGQVLIAGGNDSASCELYSPGTGTFTVTGSLPAPFWWHASVLLPDGRVLATGGGGALTETALYSAGAWTSAAPLLTAVWQHTATLLPSGRVLVAGGDVNYDGDIGGVATTFAEYYDPQ